MLSSPALPPHKAARQILGDNYTPEELLNQGKKGAGNSRISNETTEKTSEKASKNSKNLNERET